MSLDKFELSIELGNAAMGNAYDVARALREVAKKLEDGPANFGDGSGKFRDVNGNTVGCWEVS